MLGQMGRGTSFVFNMQVGNKALPCGRTCLYPQKGECEVNS